MGTVYSTLGTRLDVVEMLDGLMPGADRDLVRVWEKVNKPRFDRIMLQDEDDRGGGEAGRAVGDLRGRECAARSRSPTTRC